MWLIEDIYRPGVTSAPPKPRNATVGALVGPEKRVW